MRRRLFTAGGAVWGLSAAVTLLPFLRRPAPPGQLPGFMTAQGLDARGPYILIVALVLLALAGAIGGRILATRFATARPWAVRASCVALFLTPWIALEGGGIALTLVPVAAVVLFARLQNYDPRWSREDVLLVPSFLAAHLAALELFIQLQPVASAILAASLVLGVRLLVAARWRHPHAPGRTFVAAPIAFLFELRMTAGDHPADAAMALLIACAAPFALRFLPISARVVRLAFPLCVVLYAHLLAGFNTPIVNLFEHGFSLMNASEMLRGEALYRDLIPAHGALADGVIDWIGMRAGGPTLGAALTARYCLALLVPLALYAVALAATGSAEIAFVAVLGSISLAPAPVSALAELSAILFPRPVPSLFALACAVRALRCRSSRWLFAGGALAAIAWLTSLEFGLYAIAAVAFAALRFSRERVRALTWTAAGVAAIAIPVAIYLAAKGILGHYFRTTFIEIPALSPVYNFGFPVGTAAFPEIVFAAVADPAVFPFVAWLIIVAALATALVLSPLHSSRRMGPLLAIAVWIAACGISFAQRRHFYFYLELPLLLAAAAWQMRRTRWIALALAVVFVATTHFGPHVAEAMPNAVRDREELVRRDLTTYPLPRARGALIRKEDAARLDLIRGVFEAELRHPADTFFNFVNMPILYFLFDRAAPFRYGDVPMMESEAAQRRVIDTIERDPHIRLALVAFPYWAERIDGIDNRTRAPLVWEYLSRRFEVIYARDGAVIMRRRGA
ncbi:MAG TPA: hypothetical protein VNA69_15080 [Thermoanaerobaculia bacterium]|nr:hypothetical protein [Thermoanaerobaculia bacterium]